LENGVLDRAREGRDTLNNKIKRRGIKSDSV
jgi:hypothetical protein